MLSQIKGDYHRRDEEGLSLHITAWRKGEDDEVVVGRGLPLNYMETEGSHRDVLVSKHMSMHMHSKMHQCFHRSEN